LSAIAPIIAVVSIDALEDEVPLARASLAGNLRAIAVTFHTPVALYEIGYR
jgi:2-keto-3-deoxy-6-phosphogluconate aldolase